MPNRAFSVDGSLVKTASLPITTPCSLAPISAPHIHHGRDTSTAWVWATCGISIQVQLTRSPAGWSEAGIHSSGWASLGSRSLFLANITPLSVMVTNESHIRAPTSGGRRYAMTACHRVSRHGNGEGCWHNGRRSQARMESRDTSAAGTGSVVRHLEGVRGGLRPRRRRPACHHLEDPFPLPRPLRHYPPGQVDHH